MKKFLIEVPHGPDKMACEHAIKVFQESGSHFLTHAEWGCMDGEHKAWIIIEVDNKEDARHVVPPLFRHEAKITELVTFTLKDFQSSSDLHPEMRHLTF